METPDVDEASAFLVHPGVRAYVNGEQRSWFDKYSDYIYLGLFLGSGLGSVAAGMFGWMRGSSTPVRPPLPRQRIELVFDAVRDAKTAVQLDAAEREADDLLRSVFALGVDGKLSGEAIASFNLAMSDLRSRISARRNVLGTG
jgi:hypothetical protein